jgi:phosphatidate cytidylyltransferase
VAQRIVVSLLLLPLFALLLQSFPVVLGLCALGHLWAQLELTSLIHGLSPVGRWVHSLFSTALLCWFAWQLHTGTELNLLLVLLLTVIVYAVLAVAVAERDGDPHVPWLLIRALALITLPMAFLPGVANYGGTFPYLVLAVGASWGADVGAIFAGKLCGRTPLAPALSPKKTIEGAVAGMLTAGTIWACALVLYDLDGGLSLLLGPLPAPAVVALLGVAGMLTAMLGILSDLAFSLFKRQAHIKDYSALIPGHGGLLDRIDSLLLIVPLVYCLAYGF